MEKGEKSGGKSGTLIGTGATGAAATRHPIQLLLSDNPRLDEFFRFDDECDTGSMNGRSRRAMRSLTRVKAGSPGTRKKDACGLEGLIRYVYRTGDP